MPLTHVDEKAALVVIDLQKGITGMPAAHPMEEIVGRAAQLAEAFRSGSLPVVLVNVTGMAPGRVDAARPSFSPPADWTEIVPELGPHPSDILISKQRWGAFLGTALDDVLKARGVTQVFLAGVATGVGVESTARSAYDLGYNVVLVSDAMTDRDAEAHRTSVERVFPRLGEVETAAGVIAALRNSLYRN